MDIKRITATFHPQAWVNDYAIDVDPEGETQFDVTDVVVGMETARALKDNTYESDELRNLPSAPEWVQEWQGPFYISVEDSIRDYFGVLP